MRIGQLLTVVTITFCGLAARSNAAIVSATQSTIAPGTLYSYPNFGGGDVVFQLSTNSLNSQCVGFWLRASDPGFKSTLAALLVAEATQAPIVAFVDTSQIWGGNASPFCLIDMIAQ